MEFSYTKIGEIASGFCLRVTNCLFFCHTTNWHFDHLFCTSFDHFLNERRDLVSACMHRSKNLEFLCKGFSGLKNWQNHHKIEIICVSY